MRKILIIVCVVTVIGLAFWWFYFYLNERSFAPFYQKKFLSENSAIRYIDNLSEKYGEDYVGSTTPDGTLDLLKDALLKEDIKSASALFILEKQKYYFDGFSLSRDNNALKFFIDDLNRPRDGSFIGSSTYQAEITSQEGVVIDYDLILNPHTNIWKIESL